MTARTKTLLTQCEEGLTELDGTTFYVIPNATELAPFLMSIVGDSDCWCFISSTGALTAGRRDAATALFPYETDDRLHLAAGISGPATVLRVGRGEDADAWEPFGRAVAPGSQRAVAKSVLGHIVFFEEVNADFGLAVQYRWSTSDRFGFVRRVELANIGSAPCTVEIADGIVNVLPAGLVPDQYRSMSNLTNAYRRSELVGSPALFGLHTLEALLVDQAMPAESLRATVTWSHGPDRSTVTLDGRALDHARASRALPPAELITGRPGAHVVLSTVTLEPGESRSWYVVADVAQDHSSIAHLRRFLTSGEDVMDAIEASMEQGSRSLGAKLGAGDAFQHTGDPRASAHHVANVLFNIMRGGVFEAGYRCSAKDFASFVEDRNRSVTARCSATLSALPSELEHRDLVARAAAAGDADLERLAMEYLPLTFSRRHGDPSRPWNHFSIQVHEPDGTPILHHEGNWRDIFQNWDALCLSFPEYLPSVVSVFVNATTADGFNPYRITRRGFEWETPNPDDPWSNIGYWGDHQIVYLSRLLEATDRMLPGTIRQLLDRRIFTYADVPYRLKPYEQLVTDPHSTIEFDEAAAQRTLGRVDDVGGDGKLLPGPSGGIYHVSLMEKLLVPALNKLSNLSPGGGIWMNTQRPEWNDANNALVGNGVSMVTLCYLRRFLDWLARLAARCDHESFAISSEVAGWLSELTHVLRDHSRDAVGPVDGDRRATFMGELGRVFSEYRSKVYANGLDGTVEVPTDAIVELCTQALPHIDATIEENRRADGLYHSYNLLRFSADGSEAIIDRLPEMLEGQVAVLSCGILDPVEAADVIDSLYASALYRPDQQSFILYPDRRLPGFLEKNVIAPDHIEANPLLEGLLAAGDTSVLTVDVEGRHHFAPELRNASDLEIALDHLSAQSDWRALVAAHREDTLDTYEQVFHHHEFTGRSGTMYAYEGLGSIYWHMVAKLMVAVQEAVIVAYRSGADIAVVDRLRRSYYRVRAGLGFNKTALEYGAFPTDPYSHTPAQAGAQQPGMTGQVKEEILTRAGELGVWIEDGKLLFDAVLLQPRELLTAASEWTFLDVNGREQALELEAGSLGLTVCQVPVVVAAAHDAARIEVVRSDGTVSHVDASALDRTLTREIFGRSGEVTAVFAYLPRSALAGESVDPSMP